MSTLASSSNGCIVDTWDFSVQHEIDHQVLIGVLKSLHGDSYILDEPLTTTFWTLTEEGEEIRSKGSPEYQVYNAVPAEGMEMTALQVALGEVVKIGLGPCMKSKWLSKQGDRVVRTVENVQDETAQTLGQVAAGVSVSEEKCKDLKRRKLVQQVTRKSLKIMRGPEFREKRTRKMADLTKEMLGSKTEVRSISLSACFNCCYRTPTSSNNFPSTQQTNSKSCNRWQKALIGPT